MNNIELENETENETENDAEVFSFIKQHKTILYNILKKKQRDELVALDYTIKTMEVRKIIAGKKINECPICFDNNVDTCIVPCGHTFCHKCIESARNCYMCNQEIFLKQKVFL
jgi:hypothetical protein